MGMGCWAIGGAFWNGGIPVGYSGSDDDTSVQTINAAWDAGIRIFDTSAVYGAGHSENLLGRTIADKPDAVIVSKFGHSFNVATKQMTGPQIDPDYIRQSVFDSKHRLQRDCIDVMLLHLNDLEIAKAEGVFDTLSKLRDQGHIGSFGWSTDFPKSLAAFSQLDGFDAVQHAMNVFNPVPAICETAEQSQVTQIIRSPLGMGVLTGKFTQKTVLPTADIRSNSPDWQSYFINGKISPKCESDLNMVRELLTTGGRTIAQGALGWLLAKSPNILPIPGAKTPGQILENVAALDHGPLPQDTMAEIEHVLQRPPEGPPQQL
jgi:aryl-alcohol dehydrogenase-like predicted oxidoreductase